MHLSGRTINLISNDYTATIVTIGGAIAALKYKGRDITLPFNPETIPLINQGKVLAPWPNRIFDGKYLFKEKEYQLPITEVETNCALHGLVAWQQWEIADMRQSSVELETYITPRYGYPFLIKMIARYEVIDGMGLKIDLKAINVGKTEAPFGVGMHPFLTCESQLIDECNLTMPFKRCYKTDANKRLLDLVEVDELGYNFNTTRQVEGTVIDNCFLAPDTSRMTSISIENKKLQVYLKSSAPFYQIFTPHQLDRKCIAIEPMSCVPDAFNNGVGLIVLQSQQVYTLNFLIGALEK